MTVRILANCSLHSLINECVGIIPFFLALFLESTRKVRRIGASKIPFKRISFPI